MTEELLRFATELDASPARKEFVNTRVKLLVDTHYNIALIYDDDRERGMQRAREFRELLARNYPAFHASGEKRFRMAQVLHYLGFNAERLDKLMGRR